MILDSAQIRNKETLNCEVCIVGGGAAGISMACELGQKRVSVILLEAGGESYEESVQADYKGAVAAGSTHAELSLYRRRMFGGSTTIWGGRCVPLDPIDFERRAYVPNSGWPITRKDLDPFYVRAHRYCQAGEFSYALNEVFDAPVPPTIDGFTSSAFDTNRIERFSKPTNFGKEYRKRLATMGDVRVILHSPCRKINLNNDGSAITSVTVSPGVQKDFFVKARFYVIAAGGIETTRLLLASDESRRGGLGNQSGALGRNYMCHLESTLGILRLLPAARPVVVNFERTSDSVYVRRKLVIEEESQRHLQLLNSTFRLHYPLIADPSHRHPILSSMYLVKELIIPEYRKKIATIEAKKRDAMNRSWRFHARHASNVLLGIPEILRFSEHWMRRRTFAKRKMPFVTIHSRAGTYPLDFNSEQVPNQNSRLTLESGSGRLDIRKVKVDWRLTEADVQSVVGTFQLLRAEVARANVGQLDLADEELAESARNVTPVGGHHIGTARMSVDAQNGVVNEDCRVHGIANLYVASSAVFPTCGHANPTLTIVALALRLSDHLVEQLELANSHFAEETSQK